jgi:hypothetical protein
MGLNSDEGDLSGPSPLVGEGWGEGSFIEAEAQYPSPQPSPTRERELSSLKT